MDTLDHFAKRQGIERLSLIKIDVDGHELPVLRGGLGVLKKFQPTLVMELSPYVHGERHQDFASFVALLREVGYYLQDAHKWKSLPIDAANLEADPRRGKHQRDCKASGAQSQCPLTK